ncbi:RTA1 like protein-domain-containing protein [Mycena galopus ATCC 62051]|nr:RTA1 like protein-domain-containing protein [Mycena galopus ATCC 62051]
MSRLFSALILTACFANLVAGSTNTTTDPNTDPIGGFVPNKSLSCLGLIFYGASGLVHWYHFFTVPPRSWFMVSLPLGMTTMAAGFALRILYANPPFTVGKYIAMDLCILLSPCLFLTTDYMLLSHIARTFDKEVTDRCLFIRQSRITKIFVWSDIITFQLQSGGGGLQAAKNASLSSLGNKLALFGLLLQALSFGIFTALLIVFGSRIHAHFPELWHPQNRRPFKVLSRRPIEDWRILLYVVGITCIGILIRSIFRIAEYAGGYSGVIATHEAYFYVFDAIPLWISMSLYCIVWPVRALTTHSGLGHNQLALGSRQNLSQPKSFE